jgi:hypothetical protein
MWLTYAIIAGVAYATLDFVLGILLGRCVLPGLKCRACRDYEQRHR